MRNSHLSTEISQNSQSLFPSCLLPHTYGTSLFWAEEYWAITRIGELEKNFPNVDFTGIINPQFKKMFPELISRSHLENILDTKRFFEITKVLWENNRRIINIATSHAPSRFIAKNYLKEYTPEELVIITFDAHLDLSDHNSIHSAWITKELASVTAVIGGWEEASSDIADSKSSLAFFAPDIESLISNRDFLAWLKGKKIYLSLDLDYFRLSQGAFLGYSNYWHREKIIGHSMNLGQLLQEKNEEIVTNKPLVAGIILGFFPNFEYFEQKKKKIIRKQTKEILHLLLRISRFLHDYSANILSIDFVEYSPICDWRQLTIKEFLANYDNFFSTIQSIIWSPS
ncbi:MAG: hypothetical protein JSV04_09320 [Candidatus Heimdallarchaeota archaeon]|nr:MAG: hypothetical protein JSV04_09320 [Candidatus Heimdallarchaeota archaeon]